MSTDTSTAERDHVADRLAQLDGARAAKDAALERLQAEYNQGHRELWATYTKGLHALADKLETGTTEVLAEYDQRNHEIQPEEAPADQAADQ